MEQKQKQKDSEDPNEKKLDLIINLLKQITRDTLSNIQDQITLAENRSEQMNSMLEQILEYNNLRDCKASRVTIESGSNAFGDKVFGCAIVDYTFPVLIEQSSKHDLKIRHAKDLPESFSLETPNKGTFNCTISSTKIQVSL